MLNSLLTVQSRLEAVRFTQTCAGWLLGLAEVSKHPDAAAAARWLEFVGQQAFLSAANAAASLPADIYDCQSSH